MQEPGIWVGSPELWEFDCHVANFSEISCRFLAPTCHVCTTTCRLTAGAGGVLWRAGEVGTCGASPHNHVSTRS
ncbi:MAG: hypothetical protein FJ333_03115 [Sphingomonadales bacterium]|nr:hypothetical protein [Sphingomonadales bacterium]